MDFGCCRSSCRAPSRAPPRGTSRGRRPIRSNAAGAAAAAVVPGAAATASGWPSPSAARTARWISEACRTIRSRRTLPRLPDSGSVAPGGPAHEYLSEGTLRVVKFAVGPLANNAYLIAFDDEAVIVDGASAPERILPETKRIGARATAILQTHNHFDHTGALSRLLDALQV